MRFILGCRFGAILDGINQVLGAEVKGGRCARGEVNKIAAIHFDGVVFVDLTHKKRILAWGDEIGFRINNLRACIYDKIVVNIRHKALAIPELCIANLKQLMGTVWR